MTRGRCPACGQRVPRRMAPEIRSCECGRELGPDDIHLKATSGAVGALWSAVHALEDKASNGRWRSRQPQPPPHLEETIERAEEEAEVLRDVLKQSDGENSP